jgi:hypothetical protein
LRFCRTYPTIPALADEMKKNIVIIFMVYVDLALFGGIGKPIAAKWRQLSQAHHKYHAIGQW